MINTSQYEMLQPTIDIANNTLVPTVDDYVGVGGLLYCSKCNTPRQKVLPDNRTVYILCECRTRENEEKEAAEKLRRIEKIRIEQLCDEKYRHMTFVNSDYDLEVARNYVDKWDYMFKHNIGLLLYGSVGTGKTYSAAAIANAIIDKTPITEPKIVNNTISLKSIEERKKYYVYMNNIASLVNMMSDTYGGGYDECMKMMRESALVVIDDVGVERSTEYVNEKIYDIINTRMNSNKPLIVTTNIDIKRMRNPETLHEKRIYSRLLSLQLVPYVGTDKRIENMKQTRQDVHSILNIKY